MKHKEAHFGFRVMHGFLLVPLIIALLFSAGIRVARASNVLVIDPTYFDPTSDPSDWARFITYAPAGSMAIMNPNNGPYIGSTTSPINQSTDATTLTYLKEYRAEVAALHNSGLLVLGYVSTQGGCRPYVPYTNPSGYYDQGIYADIAEWKNLYGVDGIFLDEGPAGGTWSYFLPNFKDYTTGKSLISYPTTGTSGQTFYTPVYSDIQSLLPSAPVVLNPGIPTDQGYMNVCTILSDAEEPYSTYTTNTWLAGQFASGAWEYNYPADRFLHIVYALASGSTSDVAEVESLAESWNVGYVYCTDLAGYSGLAGATVWDDEVSYGGVTGAPTPATPGGVAASTGYGYVSLTWNPVSRAASYNVYKGTASGGEGTTPYRTGLISPSLVDTVVNNGTTYYYTVAAVNSASTSGQSVEVNGDPHSAVPATPTGLVATGGSAQNNLEWTPVVGAVEYNIYRGTTSGGEGTTAYKTGVTTTTFSDTGLTNGTEYFYTVATVNSGGTSGQSSEVNATPAGIVPTAPYGLQATDTSGQVALTWYTSALATSYNVYRGTTSGGETLLSSGLTGATYTNTGVTNGTTYYYEVAAIDAAGTSPMSAEMSTAPQSSAPSAPTNLTATGASGQITINWTAVPGATSYDIANSLSSGTETVFQTGVTGTTYTNTGLTNGTAYYFKVSAVNSVGTSALSNEAVATPSGPPGAPAGLTATPGNTQISLTWTANGATSYNVYRGTTSGGESLLTSGLTSASYVNTGLTNGTTYYYEVAAVNGAGTSSVSAEVSGTPAAPPGTPTGLTATAGNAQVSLSWSASSGATSYSVYRGTTSGGETLLVSGVTSTSYVNTGLTNGTTYYYKVAAVDSAGTSAESSEVSATPAGPPSTPTGLAATAGNAQVSLTWTTSSGATSYNVYRSTTSGGEGTTPIASGVTTASYTNTGLTNATTYYYKVAAVDSVGTSAQSSEVSSTPNNFPAVPTGLTATAGNTQVSLSWSTSSGATSYNVYRGTTSGGESATPIATGLTSTTYTNTGLTNTTTYYYKVAAVNSVGTSAESAEVSSTPNGPPSTPTGLAATAGIGQVALTWTATTNTSSYNVYRGTTSGEKARRPISQA